MFSLVAPSLPPPTFHAGYLSAMKTFALNQKTDEWILLEFSQLGFIGKLFKTTDIPSIIQFIIMFYKDKPIDWLLDHYVYVRVCNLDKDAKHCQRQKESVRIRFKPSLFQHVGTHSSLPGKVSRQLATFMNRQNTWSMCIPSVSSVRVFLCL